ncbi:MAG: phosphoribosylaminoimidazolesuccinocarboxamide synthase [Vicinamibacterales bacterium]
MKENKPLLETSLSGLKAIKRGKVRDLYQAGDAVLIVATDRISAFDYVLPTPIPDKGKVLSQLSAFWFTLTEDLVANHVIATDVSEYPPEACAHAEILAGRSMLVRRTVPLPVECVVRGYMAGSGWKEYRQSGAICGIPLPPGLRESDRLPEPIFTPSTKADTGHDQNITQAQVASLVGADVAELIKELSIALYKRATEHAEPRGIIVADTKFEFGLAGDASGMPQIILIDEALTPDSSRFWPLAEYEPGRSQPSFDKQFVRDYLESIRWNKRPPVPELPEDVVARTREKYLEAFRRLTGRDIA